MKKIKRTIGVLLSMAIMLSLICIQNIDAYAAAAGVTYRSYVQSIGWQGWKANGALSGTTGQSKRIEAIQLKLKNKPVSGSIVYRSYVQGTGWQSWKSNGDKSGTTGQSKRIEAIQVKLTQNMAKKYDVYYRVYAQSYGWLGWAKNGQSAGTSGLYRHIESIEVKLVKKGGKAPASSKAAYQKKK